MLRLGLCAVARALRTTRLPVPGCQAGTFINTGKLFTTFAAHPSSYAILSNPQSMARIMTRLPIVRNPQPAEILTQQPSRNVTKFSLNKGKRKSVKAVLKRFKRLHWGAWIRTRCGRHKKMWKKSSALKKRLRQHVFVNGQQATLLDKMVTNFWRKPKYYIDDPYTPYHSRNEFQITKKKSW